MLNSLAEYGQWAGVQAHSDMHVSKNDNSGVGWSLWLGFEARARGSTCAVRMVHQPPASDLRLACQSRKRRPWSPALAACAHSDMHASKSEILSVGRPKQFGSDLKLQLAAVRVRCAWFNSHPRPQTCGWLSIVESDAPCDCPHTRDLSTQRHASNSILQVRSRAWDGHFGSGLI